MRERPSEAHLLEAMDAPRPDREETILLVDDEVPVRRVTERVLARWGYHVLSAGSGEEALALARAHRGGIDLLISDLSMPDMNGRELATALRAIRPGIAVLFLSGQRPVHAPGSPASDEPFLQKPFTVEELTAKVREVLPAA